jgi:hypothetical protein
MADLFGYIYIIKFGPHYKIGKSADSIKRWLQIVDDLLDFEPQLPFEACCPLHFKCWSQDLNSVESALHKHFSDKRLRGEWFDLSTADLEWLVDQKEIPMFTEPGYKMLPGPPWIAFDDETIACPS